MMGGFFFVFGLVSGELLAASPAHQTVHEKPVLDPSKAEKQDKDKSNQEVKRATAFGFLLGIHYADNQESTDEASDEGGIEE